MRMYYCIVLGKELRSLGKYESTETKLTVGAWTLQLKKYRYL